MPLGLRLFATLISIVQRGFVSMMAVGDYQFLVRHGLLRSLNRLGIGNLPYPVLYSIFVTDINVGIALWPQRLLHFLFGIAVEHKDLAKMSARGPQQVEAVCL